MLGPKQENMMMILSYNNSLHTEIDAVLLRQYLPPIGGGYTMRSIWVRNIKKVGNIVRIELDNVR